MVCILAINDTCGMAHVTNGDSFLVSVGEDPKRVARDGPIGIG